MANRLLELEEYLTTVHPVRVGREVRATPGAAPPRSAMRSAAPVRRGRGRTRRASVRAFSAPVSYRVPGIVPALAQPSGMTCWATVATMMISWKENRSIPIADALSLIGGSWAAKFHANKGLTAAEKPVFLAAAGLIPEPPMNPSIDGWASMLRRYGPLWVTTDEAAGDDNWAIHARVMRGIHGDGTPDGTRVDIVDPAGGREYTETFAHFQAKFEEEVSVMVRRRNPSPLRLQIVHWPSETGIGVQQSLRSAQLAGPAVVPIAGLGIAVFNSARGVATQGDISFTPVLASHVFPNTPPDSPRTRSTMDLKISAHHPRRGIGTQHFYFKLDIEHNGHDILMSRINLLRDRSSSLYASTFSINFDPKAGTSANGRATIRFLLDGRWDPMGRGDVSFRGELLIRPDGWAGIEIESDRGWVSVAPNAFDNVRREPMRTPRRQVESHEIFFDPPASDTVQAGTERGLLDWFDRLPADVQHGVRSGVTPVVIHGHASSTGSDDRNRELARRRAQRVETILRDHLGPTARLEVQSHGERGAGPDGVEDRSRRKVRVEITRFL
jgi:outer membrane protein OmpA-like peptidoglycan-associated protein